MPPLLAKEGKMFIRGWQTGMINCDHVLRFEEHATDYGYHVAAVMSDGQEIKLTASDLDEDGPCKFLDHLANALSAGEVVFEVRTLHWKEFPPRNCS